MPGIKPPAARLTRGMTRSAVFARRFSVRTSWSPSSISEVKVRPSAAALRRARSSRSSGKRTVVRSIICQDILYFMSLCLVNSRRLIFSFIRLTHSFEWIILIRMAAENLAPNRNDLRLRLLEAAIDVFGRHGFDGASTRMLAKAAGVNLQAIPYHFGGKEGLYLAVDRK